MALDYAFGGTITKAIRNLLQGRVLLHANCAAGDTVVPVGGRDDVHEGITFPGFQLFLNNTDAATIVQPAATNIPDAIEHQENVTIDDDTFAASNTGDIVLEAALTKAYTLARGAYIRLRTIPDVCDGLKFIQSDFIPSLNLQPIDEWFPGVLVCKGMLDLDSAYTNSEIAFRYLYRVYYCDVLLPDRDNTEVLWEKAEELASLVMEDNYLGGTVLESNVTRLVPWSSTDTAMRGQRFITATRGLEVGWVQFDVSAWRPSVWAKQFDF